MDAQRVRAPNERVARYFAEAELESIAKTLVVPTNDDDVRRRLREIGQPAELARESRADRRLRLRRLLAQRKAAGIDEADTSEESDDDEELEESWSEGPPELKTARERIAAYAAPRTAARLQRETQTWSQYVQDKPAFTNTALTRRRHENNELKKVTLVGTQSGFPRAVGSVASSGQFVVAGDWSGSLTVLDMQAEMGVVARASAHSSIGAAQTCVAWSECVASGSADGSVALHEFTDNELKTRARMPGHTGRVSCVAFHPSDSFLLSASHDKTWRLWDLETNTCVLAQPGHTRPLNAVAPHEDGALVLSAGDDAIGRVTDLRTGQSIAVLEGHARSIHAAAWHVNKVVMGGADNQCIVWDMRHIARPLAAIPAHKDVVTGISMKANTMATSSMDGSVRLWSCDSWRLQRTLHSPTRLLAVAATDDGWVAARWDRCVDWYSPTNPFAV